MVLKKLLNLDILTKENNDFRKSLYRSENMEFVLMSIPVNGKIPLEIHKYEDQFIRVEQGNATIIAGENKQETKIKADDGIIIPEGVLHEIINTGNNELKLYIIYSPSEKEENNQLNLIFIIIILIIIIKYIYSK